MPGSMRKVVVLPAPFGPSTPQIAPSGTARSTPSTATAPSNRLTSPRASIARLPVPPRSPSPISAVYAAVTRRSNRIVAQAADIAELKERLKAEARTLGFAAVGFAPAADDPVRAERLRQWLASGAHGEMTWMEDRAEVRQGPQSMWREAQSVMALGMSYAPSVDPLALEGDAERARISVYAQGGDYHDTVKKALKALARWLVAEAGKLGIEAQSKVCVGAAPGMEKPPGGAAGVGWQGKHAHLVSREHGSWLFLGAIYATLPFEPDLGHDERCGSCTACQDACPTQAFPAPFQLDARRCISYLTIELKGPIPHELRAGIGNRIYGCDDCLA